MAPGQSGDGVGCSLHLIFAAVEGEKAKGIQRCARGSTLRWQRAAGQRSKHYVPYGRVTRTQFRARRTQSEPAMPRVSRKPSHAGSWYEADPVALARQIDGWLEAVPASALAGPATRAIIGP